MRESKNVKLVIHVPVSHADIIRQALGDAGAGVVGEYRYCSFSVRGTGRFMGTDASEPAIGTAGHYESVEEESIEVVLPKDIIPAVMTAVRAVHPYQEIAAEIHPLLEI